MSTKFNRYVKTMIIKYTSCMYANLVYHVQHIYDWWLFGRNKIKLLHLEVHTEVFGGEFNYNQNFCLWAKKIPWCQVWIEKVHTADFGVLCLF